VRRSLGPKVMAVKNFFHLLRLVVINILGVGTFVHILVTAHAPMRPPYDLRSYVAGTTNMKYL